MARISGERWSLGGTAKATQWIELGKENKHFAVEKNETMKKNVKKQTRNKVIKKKGDSLSLQLMDGACSYNTPLICGTTDLQLRVTNGRSITVNEMNI